MSRQARSRRRWRRQQFVRRPSGCHRGSGITRATAAAPTPAARHRCGAAQSPVPPAPSAAPLASPLPAGAPETAACPAAADSRDRAAARVGTMTCGARSYVTVRLSRIFVGTRFSLMKSSGGYLVPRRWNRLIDGERFEARLDQPNLARAVVREVDRAGRRADLLVVDVHQRPGRIRAHIQPPPHAAAAGSNTATISTICSARRNRASKCPSQVRTQCAQHCS